MKDNDRIFVSTSYMAGSAEVTWAAASGGIFARDDEIGNVDGEMLVHMDGRATMKWWDGDEPFVLVIDPRRTMGAYVSIYASEDQPPSEDAHLLWSSARDGTTLDVERLRERAHREYEIAKLMGPSDDREAAWLTYCEALVGLSDRYLASVRDDTVALDVDFRGDDAFSV